MARQCVMRCRAFFWCAHFQDTFSDIFHAQKIGNMRKSTLFFFLFSFDLCLAQEIKYVPPACSDSIKVEELNASWDRASYHFFGGEDQLLRFLKINLYKQIENGEMPSGEMRLSISIDTLGNCTGVEIVKQHNSCTTCAEKLRNTVSRIHRWKPDCYYSILDNKVKCENKAFFLNIKIDNKMIFIVPTN